MINTNDDDRIYGIDKGNIVDTELYKTMSEIDLFFNIEAAIFYIFNCGRLSSHGLMPKVDLTEEQYALEYMVYQTTRFGVELTNPQKGMHIETTPSYDAWYSFYSTYFNETLNENQLKVFQKEKAEGKDVSKYMPKGNWKDSLEKPVIKTLA